jgi:hypothetical protein
MPRGSEALEARWVVRGRDKDGRPVDGCRHCDRDNYFHAGAEPAQFAYRRSDVGEGPLPDVAYTWECFGRSYLGDRGLRIARPRVLMSARVFDILRRLKIRKLEFTPVRIIED